MDYVLAGLSGAGVVILGVLAYATHFAAHLWDNK